MSSRIVFVTPVHISYGRGFERWLGDITKMLARFYNFDILVISTKYLKEHENLRFLNLDKKINVYVVPSIFWFPNSILIHKVIEPDDLVYINCSFAGIDYIAYNIKKKRSSVKIIGGFHGPLQFHRKIKMMYWKLSSNIFLYYLDVLHVLNKDRYKLMQNWGLRNIVRIPNGIDTNVFSISNIGKKLNKHFNVLYVGALEPYKGVLDVLQVFRVFSSKFENVQLTLIGRGSLKEKIEKIACNSQRIRYLGYLSRKELVKEYEEANILLALSHIGYEEFLLTPLEAASCGTPSIVRDIPGPRDYALSPFINKVNSMVDALHMLKFFYELWSKNPYQYIKICTGCRTYAQRFDWSKIIRLYYRLFKSLRENRKLDSLCLKS